MKNSYNEEQIGIAAGYFNKFDNNKTINKEDFQKAKSIAFQSIDQDKIKELELNTPDPLEIFNNNFCSFSGAHGFTEFILLKKVKDSKELNYLNSDLKDWNIETLIADVCCTASDEEEAKELIDIYSFKEPMMYVDIEEWFYLNEDLEDDELYFSEDEIGKNYGILYKDCIIEQRY